MQRADTHNHTRYSNLRLRDALSTPEKLIDKAIELGLAGVAITDHECLSAHPSANFYYEKIKEEHPNFKIILGDEIYLTDERPTDNHWHYILLAKDEIGHHQLRQLSSIAWLNSYMAKGLTRVDLLKSELEEVVLSNPGHLIAQTACIGGELGYRILQMTFAEKRNLKEDIQEHHQGIVDFILWNKKLFKDDFYIECQPGISNEQIIVNKRLVSIAKCFNLKMIATSDTHYLRPEDRFVHKAFLNSENKEREVDAFYQDAYLHTNEEMIEKFSKSDFSEAFVEEMFKNSLGICNKIKNYSLAHAQQIPKVKIDNYKRVIKDIRDEEGNKYETLSSMYNSEDNYDRCWINRCIDKLIEINKYNKVYLEELEEEAEVKYIVGKRLDTNMFSYPITLSHYIDTIWEIGSTVGAGRGSACSALNHYLLGITQLDPIEQSFPFFRYINRDTMGLGDIDIDLAPSKIKQVIAIIRNERSQNFNNDIKGILRNKLGANYVCTFGTESAKSAILTSCRGYRSEDYPDGIDIDTAQYLSSLVPQERGFVWSISDTYFGNEDKDRKPVYPFIQEIDKYEGLLDIILGVEGCISRRGRHASGVLFLDEDPFEFNAFMTTPNGEVVTQYDLHAAEACGSTKFDLLVTEVQDKIIQTIKFLQKDGLIESELTLRQAYDKYLHPDVLPLDDKATWKTIQTAGCLDLFQLDSQVGRQGAKKVKPNNMIELSSTNGLIRLMTTEKGAETWLDKYVRFKNRPQDMNEEIYKYRLTKAEIENLGKYIADTKYIGISQEQFMKIVLDKDLCGFNLAEANAGRKIISKKQIKKIPELKEKFFKKASSENLGNFVWDYVVAPQLSYSFSDIHSISYSYIGFQTAYLATHWNPIYWNTACLIVNSGSLEDNSTEELVSIYAPEAADLAEGTTFEDLPDRSGKIKKISSTDYSKTAKALGSIMSAGIKVSLVDINRSSYSFIPDVENNQILFGLKGLNKINDSAVEEIMKYRPYTGIEDFIERCPINKLATISLIKGGAFDRIDYDWAIDINQDEPRVAIMEYYISQISEPKKRLTMQNFNGLIEKDMIPNDLDFEKRVFKFNKYLKTKKKSNMYMLDEPSLSFYSKYFDADDIQFLDDYCIEQRIWDNHYKNVMLKAKEWIVDNQEEVLKNYNNILFKETWNKYASGNMSSWEMESMCFYYHDHELSKVDNEKYGISNFFELPTEPIVEKTFKRAGKNIPIYKLTHLAGTVISKDDTRSLVSLLTVNGVVNVKFSKEHYAMYNRQLSEVQKDGTKKITDKSWLTRGNLIFVTGMRREDQFFIKTYSHTSTHSIYKIIGVNNEGKELELISERN